MTTTTTTTLPPARRLPAAAWGQMLLTEARMVLRDTAGLVLPIGLPTLLLVMNGIGQDGDQVLPDGSTVMNSMIMPLTLSMVITLVGVVNMPTFLATYRKSGVLRRLAVTPARPSLILIAQMVISVVQVLVGIALMMAIGAIFFDVTLPVGLGWALLVGVLMLAAMYGLGTFIAAVAPSVNAVMAMGLVVFFAMIALGGALGGADNLPGVLQSIGQALPYGAGSEALSAAWNGERPQTQHIAVLGGWAVVTGGLAAKLFRWS